MKLVVIVLTLAVASCPAQSRPASIKPGNAETKGTCSPAVSGDRNKFVISCGIGEQQGAQMIAILNKVLKNSLDPTAVMAKLDEILRRTNPNLPVKVYDCEGNWKAASPGSLIGEVGSPNEFLEPMLSLYSQRRFPELLASCNSQITEKPGWLTPLLFCAEANYQLGSKELAKSLFDRYEEGVGPHYKYGICNSLESDLRSRTK